MPSGISRGFLWGCLAASLVLVATAFVLYKTNVIKIAIPTETIFVEPLGLSEKETGLPALFVSSETYLSGEGLQVLSDKLWEYEGRRFKYDSDDDRLYIDAIHKATRSDFDELKAGMTLDEVETIVGIDHGPAPTHSGMYIPCYYLEDGTRMDLYYDYENGIAFLQDFVHEDEAGNRTVIF